MNGTGPTAAQLLRERERGEKEREREKGAGAGTGGSVVSGGSSPRVGKVGVSLVVSIPLVFFFYVCHGC